MSRWEYKSGSKAVAEAAMAGNVVSCGGNKYDMNPSRKNYLKIEEEEETDWVPTFIHDMSYFKDLKNVTLVNPHTWESDDGVLVWVKQPNEDELGAVNLVFAPISPDYKRYQCDMLILFIAGHLRNRGIQVSVLGVDVDPALLGLLDIPFQPPKANKEFRHFSFPTNVMGLFERSKDGYYNGVG